MNKAAVALIAIIIVAAISGSYAYTNFYAIKDSDVTVSNSNVTISNSTITFGENNTFTNTSPHAPQETPAAPLPTPKSTVNKTFIVYRWTLTNGTVTLELLKSYYQFIGIYTIPVLFTYKIGETSGLAAYDAEWHGRSYEADYMKNIVERFEMNLSSVSEWTKTEQTVEIEANLNGIQLQYADVFG